LAHVIGGGSLDSHAAATSPTVATAATVQERRVTLRRRAGFPGLDAEVGRRVDGVVSEIKSVPFRSGVTCVQREAQPVVELADDVVSGRLNL
jgi:hypothetical protein